jgi:adenylate kinase
MKEHLVLFGPPGSGKDTQGKILSSELVIPHISSGAALREEISNGTAVGKRFQSLINEGHLVPDDFMCEFFLKLLSKYDLVKGFVLNGLPRTAAQAEFIDDFLRKVNASIDVVVSISVSDEEIIKRLSGRRTCSKCGAVYNIYYYQPKVVSVCDVCGGTLYQRDDDREEPVKNRIEVYKKETLPLFNYYAKKGLLCAVDGNGAVEEVNQRIMGVIND